MRKDLANMEDNEILEEMETILETVGDWSIVWDLEGAGIDKDVNRYYELADEAEKRNII